MTELLIHSIEVTPFAQNARVIFSKGSKESVVVDPGGDVDKILNFLSNNSLVCSEIWLTHSHLDHCGGVKRLKEITGAKLLGHPIETEFRAHVVDICRAYGIEDAGMENCPEPDLFIQGGEKLEFLGHNFDVLFTPGHSPGHVCFYNMSSAKLIAGDTLFAGSIGRTDLPGGNHETLLSSIREKIFSLPDETLVMPGHGPDTTVKEEKKSNPFLK